MNSNVFDLEAKYVFIVFIVKNDKNKAEQTSHEGQMCRVQLLLCIYRRHKHYKRHSQAQNLKVRVLVPCLSGKYVLNYVLRNKMIFSIFIF